MPRYVMVWDSHWNGKLFLHCVTSVFGRVIFRAFDLEKFICRLESNLNREKSLSRLGMVVIGSVRNSKMSSA